jgi:LacI family transcriptional regulator
MAWAPAQNGEDRGLTDGPDRKARPARLADIAAMTGVGIATVDRVLNERGNVSEKTTHLVLSAAKRLNLKRILPSPHHRLLRIEALLARPHLPLISRLNQEFARLAQRIDKSVIIQRTLLKSDSPEPVAKAIEETKCDGVVMYTQAHPLIHAAIAKCRARGVAMISILSDLPDSERLAYAGMDHYAGGRTAAQFMGWTIRAPGAIIAIGDHSGFRAHAQRVEGLRDGLRQYAPHLEVTEMIAARDDSALSERLLLQSFKAHGRVAGVYSVGAATDACGRAIKAAFPESPPVYVGFELTDESRRLLLDGTMTLVIDQNPEQQARFALDVFTHHFGYTERPWMEPPYRSDIAFRLFTRESLPDLDYPHVTGAN